MEDSTKFLGLKRFNFVMALLHFIQGVAVILLSTDFKLPVNTSYLKFDIQTQTLIQENSKLFDINLAWLVAGFLFISAFFHLIIATVYNKKYNENLQLGINKARWIEYSLSASTMMVAIAMLVGIYDIGALISLFALTATMNLLGLVMEVHNQTTQKTNWLSYWIGCLAGIIPWLVIAVAFWSSSHFGTGEIPKFVYWIYVSIFVFFNCFAVNMVLQYNKYGKWQDYLYGEKAYIFLSLVAKSLLAWQVFAGTLRP